MFMSILVIVKTLTSGTVSVALILWKYLVLRAPSHAYWPSTHPDYTMAREITPRNC